MPNHVKTATGEIHYYASVEDTPILMQDLLDFYNNSIKNTEIHPLVLATIFHHRIVSIHPFDDGNGRMARILMNLILMRQQFPPIVVRQEDRQNYYGVLRQADANEYLPIVEYMGELLKKSLEIQLKGIRGEDISEKSDLDKEIALLKAGLGKEPLAQVEKNRDSIIQIISESLSPLFLELSKKCKEFDELFFNQNEELFYQEGNSSQNLLQHYSWEKIITEWIPQKSGAFEKDLSGLSYRYTWMGFKKAKDPFNAQLILDIKFDRYKYKIELERNSEELGKFYHEQLSTNEREQVIKRKIRDVIDNIKKRVN